MSTLKLLLLVCLIVVLTSSTTIERVIRPAGKGKKSSSAPVKLIYINRLTSWWGAQTVPAALGVPGFTTTPLPYNYIVHTFWTYSQGGSGSGQDAVGMWANLKGNMNDPNPYGTTNDAIQKVLKQNFTNAGVKLLVSAFGSTQTPTSQGFDPVQCATALANFTVTNNYDGVDVDWEDTPSFSSGDRKGENWLITFTQTLRSQLNSLGATDAIITHAPQAPYFSTNTSLYPKGGYLTVDQQAGSIIDFYNVQFYNQGVGMYDSAEGLFVKSGGWANATSIGEIIASGVPQEKVILGKPAGTADANNGWMSAADLNSAIKQYGNGWTGGIMFWQFTSDLDGSFCNGVTAGVLGPRNVKKVVEA